MSGWAYQPLLPAAADLQSGPATLVNTVFAQDGLYFADVRASMDLGKGPIRDGLYFADARTSKDLGKGAIRDTLHIDQPAFSIEVGKNYPRDGMYFVDRTRKDADKVLRDGVYLTDQRMSEVLRHARDGLYVSEQQYREVARQLLDTFLLGDSAATEYTPPGAVNYERSVTDGLYFYDPSQRDTQKQIREGMLFVDNVSREVLISRLSAFLMADAAERKVERNVLASDGLYLLSVISRLRESVIRDNLLLGESAQAQLGLREFIYSIMDGLMFTDQHMRDTQKRILDGINVYDEDLQRDTEHYARDVLQLLDLQSRAVERRILEGLLLGDRYRKELARVIADALLLGDQATVQATAVRLYEVAQVDGLLMLDLRQSDLQKVIRDSVLLGDRTAAQIERTVRIAEQLLLADSVVRTANLTRTERDGLAMFDAVGRESLLTARDRVLLNDRIVRNVDITAQDRLLMRDVLAKALDKVMGDELLLGDTYYKETQLLITEVLELDGLLLSDQATVEWIAELLVSAILSHNSPIGAVALWSDVMGRRLGITEPLGAAASWTRPEVMQ